MKRIMIFFTFILFSNLSISSDWQTQSYIDPMTDSKDVIIGINATSGSNRYGQSPLLLAKCQNNKTQLILGWNQYLSNEYIDQTTRYDKEPPIEERWNVLTTNKAAMHPHPIKTLKKLMTVNTYLVRVTPYGEQSITASFNVEGLTEAIKPVRKECNW